MSAASPDDNYPSREDIARMTEAEYVAYYRREGRRQFWQSPVTAVDVCIFTLRANRLQVLLANRNRVDMHPDRGLFALPGGFCHIDEDVTLMDTAQRVLQAKTGVSYPYLDQWKAVGGRDRDPRYWSITVVFFALIPPVEPTDPAAQWFDIDPETRNVCFPLAFDAQRLGELPAFPPGKDVHTHLAFDHARLLPEVVDTLRREVAYTTLPAHLIPSPFTIAELKEAYETLLNTTFTTTAIRRRLNVDGEQAAGADVVLERVDVQDKEDAGPWPERRRLRGRKPEYYQLPPGRTLPWRFPYPLIGERDKGVVADAETASDPRLDMHADTTLSAKKKTFHWALRQDRLVIVRDGMPDLSIELDLLAQVLADLHQRYRTDDFALDNNVTEMAHPVPNPGLGRTLYQYSGSILKGQAASQLGPILCRVGVLAWNGQIKGIAFRFMASGPAPDADALALALGQVPD